MPQGKSQQLIEPVESDILHGLIKAMRPVKEFTAKMPRGTGFLVASGLATGASWLCYFRAMALGDAARVAPVDKLSVVLVAVFAVCFLGERLDLGDWSAIVMIFAGVLLLAVRS